MNRKTTLAGLALAAGPPSAHSASGTAVAGTHSPTKTRISNSTPAGRDPERPLTNDNVQQGEPVRPGHRRY